MTTRLDDQPGVLDTDAILVRDLGITTIRTEVDWNQFDLLGFLASEGFAASHRLCLDKDLSGRRTPPSVQ